KTNGNLGNFPGQLIFAGTNPKAAGQWAVSDYSYAHVTGDSGATWVKSALLPGPVRGVAFETAGASALWAATAGGAHVYRSAIRISTFGRGFWELYPNAGAPAGVFGNGDLDHNQIIDAFDVVREAAILFTSPADASYDPAGNLKGTTNYIDADDFGALVAKMG